MVSYTTLVIVSVVVWYLATIVERDAYAKGIAQGTVLNRPVEGQVVGGGVSITYNAAGL
jgi:hypothetical protein